MEKGNWSSPICHREQVMSERCCGVSPWRQAMDWNWRSIKTNKWFSNMLTNTQQNPVDRWNVDKTFAVYWEFNIYFCFLVHVKTTITCYTLWFSHICVNWPVVVYLVRHVAYSTNQQTKPNFLVCAHNDRNKRERKLKCNDKSQLALTTADSNLSNRRVTR